MTSLIDYFEQPTGDRAGKVMCFLQGGRYGGDRGSIAGEAPELLAVVPCDCAVDLIGRHRRSGVWLPGRSVDCGQPTHWHDVDRGDELGDIPRHAGYYVLVRTEPAPSGMRAALYVSAGHERPTRAEMARAASDFERMVRERARRLGVQITDPEGA